MADSKNYQKMQSRSASSHDTEQRTVSQQTIRYLVMNPLAVNYVLKQDIQATGDNRTIHARQSITNGKPYQYASITN